MFRRCLAVSEEKMKTKEEGKLEFEGESLVDSKKNEDKLFRPEERGVFRSQMIKILKLKPRPSDEIPWGQ